MQFSIFTFIEVRSIKKYDTLLRLRFVKIFDIFIIVSNILSKNNQIKIRP